MSANNAGYWPYTVYQGNVLRNAKGNTRKVLSAIQGDSGYTTSVMFLIKRESWTTRPVTVITYTDLALQGYYPIPKVRIPLTPKEVLIVMENNCIPAKNPEKLRFYAKDVL